MAGSMDWSRARMDVIIGQRGSERAFEPADTPPPARKSKSKRKVKQKTARTPRAGAPQPPRKTPERPVVTERRALRRRFERLSLSERRALAKEFRSRLRALSESPAACDALWRANFQPLLTQARPPSPSDKARAADKAKRAVQRTRARATAARRAADRTVAPVKRSPTPRVPLPSGLQPGARLWVTREGAREPGLLFTAVGPRAARVAVLRDGRPALRLWPNDIVAPRGHPDPADRALAKFLAGDPVGPCPKPHPAPAKKKPKGKKRKKTPGSTQPLSLSYTGGSGARPRASFWRGG